MLQSLANRSCVEATRTACDITRLFIGCFVVAYPVKNIKAKVVSKLK
jgi:hypothetical protein